MYDNEIEAEYRMVRIALHIHVHCFSQSKIHASRFPLFLVVQLYSFIATGRKCYA